MDQEIEVVGFTGLAVACPSGRNEFDADVRAAIAEQRRAQDCAPGSAA